MKKRILSCFMALALCLTLLPATALAADAEGTEHKHPICGKTDCTDSSHVLPSEGTWKSVSSLNDINEAGHYYLTDNVTLGGTWNPQNNITLDLNGKTITVEGDFTAINVIDVTFTLCDCKGTGKITHKQGKTGSGVYMSGGVFHMYGGSITGNTANVGGGVYMYGGQFTMYGGSITGNTAEKSNNIDGNGGGVYVNGGGTFTMTGGEISDGNKAKYGGGVYVGGNNSTFTMSGSASITNNTAMDNNKGTGGGVSVSTGGTFTMSGGTISGNTTDSADGGVCVAGGQFTMSGGKITGNTAISYSGGVGVHNSATFIMSGGTIGGTTEGEANKAKYGGGVNVDQYGTFTMSGGEISGNKATQKGGGVYVDGGTFTMNDGTIGGNKATNNEKTNTTYGGGVYVNGGTFTMNGKTTSVSNNTATNGGGVYASVGTFTMSGGRITGNDGNGVCVSREATFTVSGAPTVKGNTRGDDASNVFLNGGATITIGGALDEGASIGVASNDKLPVTVAKGADSYSVGEKDAKAFFSDSSGRHIELVGADVKLCHGAPHVHYLCGGATCNPPQGVTHPNCTSTTFKEWNETNKLPDSTGNWYLTEDVKLTDTWTPASGTVLCLNGCTITSTKAEMTFKVPTGNTFVLTDCQNTGALVYSGDISNGQHIGVYVNGGSFTMYNGTVKGFTTGVLVSNKFVMHGGSIINSRDVGVQNKGTFEMYGGSITRNGREAFNTGCGVYMYGTMTVGGDATIQNNTNGSNGPSCNVCLAKYSNDKLVPIIVKDGFTGSFGVTTSNPPYKNLPHQVTIGGTTNTITADNTEKHEIVAKDENLWLQVKGTTGGTTEKQDQQPLTLTASKETLAVGETLELKVTGGSGTGAVVYEAFGDGSSAARINGNVLAADMAGNVTVKAVKKGDETFKEAVSNTITITITEKTGGTTPSQPGGSTGGTTGGTTGGSTGGNTGGSTGGSSGSSSSDSSDSNPIIKTETKNNPDGSTTKTETRKDGSVTQTTTGKDGGTSKTESKPDGSSVTENKAADGSTGTIKTDKNGQTEAKTALSNKAVEDAKKNGEAVKAPVEVKAVRDLGSAPTVKVELPKGAGETKVEIPVSNVKPGTVAVLVHADGTEEIIKDSIPTENGVQLTVSGNATVKIVDNSKGFIDIRNHWAEDEIDFVSARGLVNGVSDTIYAPNNSTTRAQLWTILARQNDANLNGGNTWYEKAQNWAKSEGVSDGTDPNADINRAQMVTMLWRAVGQPAAGRTASFIDVPADAYYAGAVSWAVENGITVGVGGGRFDPNGTCTRAQVAAFLARHMK